MSGDKTTLEGWAASMFQLCEANRNPHTLIAVGSFSVLCQLAEVLNSCDTAILDQDGRVISRFEKGVYQLPSPPPLPVPPSVPSFQYEALKSAFTKVSEMLKESEKECDLLKRQRDGAQQSALDRIVPIIAARSQAWHANAKRRWVTTDYTNALAGEVGELCNVIKKWNRIQDDAPGNKPGETEETIVRSIAAEIADVFIYLAGFSHFMNLDFYGEVREKFNATSERIGFKERL